MLTYIHACTSGPALWAKTQKLVHSEFTREVSPITALMAKLNQAGLHSNVHTNGDITHTDRQTDRWASFYNIAQKPLTMFTINNQKHLQMPNYLRLEGIRYTSKLVHACTNFLL